MSSNPLLQKPGPPRRKRYKASIACTVCRSRKLKCDGLRPACSRCQKKDSLREACTYTSANESQHSHAPANTGPSRLPSITVGSTKLSAEEPDVTEVQDDPVDDYPGQFACKVKQVIDARLGLPAATNQCPIPMVDAPLFGTLSRRQNADGRVDNVLPPRNHADHLVNRYWRYIDPLEHILDQERFSCSYQTLFAGGELDCNEDIFISILNAIFALSTQLEESVLSEQRDQASNTFFQRAWTLLRPETILWEPGSLEIVQCLLLMSHYLQCTKNLHQTWMAVGSAVRIAQSLDLHMPDKFSSSSLNIDSSLRRHVWQRCVFRDRCFSWVLRRTSVVPMAALSPSINSLRNGGDRTGCCDESIEHYSVKMLELNELLGLITLSQVPSRSRLAEDLGLPRLYHIADLSASLQIDGCLSKWEKSLPPPAQLDPVQDDPDNGLSRQRILLRLQLAHARVLLFRPMLTRFCLSDSQAGRGFVLVEQGLGDRVLRECATICVENSQRIIALIYENCQLDASIGILPWWYRVFYLHVASQLLIAAMLRPDMFRAMVLESWSKAMSALSAHEHLSSAVQSGISSLKAMWQKVADIHCSGTNQDPGVEGLSNTSFQDIFQNLRFDAGDPFFGMEDTFVTGNIDWVR